MRLKKNPRVLAMAAVVAILFTAGCAGTGSDDDKKTDDSSTSSVADKARDVIEESSGKLEWFDPGPSFSAEEDLSGAKILFVTIQLNTPFSQHILTGLEKGADMV